MSVPGESSGGVTSMDISSVPESEKKKKKERFVDNKRRLLLLMAVSLVVIVVMIIVISLTTRMESDAVSGQTTRPTLMTSTDFRPRPSAAGATTPLAPMIPLTRERSSTVEPVTPTPSSVAGRESTASRVSGGDTGTTQLVADDSTMRVALGSTIAADTATNGPPMGSQNTTELLATLLST